MNNDTPAAALALAALSLEYCKTVVHSAEMAPKDFVRDMLRYLPRLYLTMADLDAGEGSDSYDGAYDSGAIYSTVDEEQYDAARSDMAALLGDNDVYLDTPVEDMRFSDTPVAVSLAEKLADIFQDMAGIAAAIGQTGPEAMLEVLADVKYRFSAYLSETICSALRAANYIYFNADFEQQ